VVIQTHAPKAEPLARLEFAAATENSNVHGIVTNEQVSVFDYPYTGMRPTAIIEGVAASRYIGMAISQPTDLVFRVVERHGSMCFPRGVASSARLRLRNPRLDFGMTEGRLDMVWNLAG